MNDKIDLVLSEIKSIKEDVSTLKTGQQKLEAGQQKLETSVQKLEAGQQKNYELIQKNGIKLEQIDSNVKGVAEGHGVLLNKIDEVDKKLSRKLDDTNLVVKETNRRLKEHIMQPAHWA